MYPVIAMFPGLTLWTYGILVALGVFITLLWTRFEANRRSLDIGSIFYGLSLVLIFAGGLGGKVFYILFQSVGPDPGGQAVSVLSRSGFSVFGAGVFILPAFFLYMKFSDQPYAVWLDVFATAIPLLETFVRLGCLSVGCCYGRTVSFGPTLVFSHPLCFAPQGVPIFPTQPLAAAFGFCSFFILCWIERHTVRPGTLMGYSLLLYSLSRVVTGHFRGDPPATIGGMQAMYLEIAIALTCSMYLLREVVQTRRSHAKHIK